MSTIRRIVGRLIITICGYKNTTLFVAFISHKWINTFLFEKKNTGTQNGPMDVG